MKIRKAWMAAAILPVLLGAACGGWKTAAKADEVTVIASGVCGSGDEKYSTSTVTYSMDSNGKMTISGNGSMEDYERKYWWSVDRSVTDTASTPPWEDYRDSIRELVVKEGVLSIGTEAFRGCGELEKISLPESLEYIRGGAFEKSGIRQIRLLSRIKTIGLCAFLNCINLTGLEMEVGIQKVGDQAFKGCTSLKSVSLPAANAWWGEDVFADCANLEKAEFAEGFIFGPYLQSTLERYDRYGMDNGCAMFHNCEKLSEVILPKSVSELPTGFFWGCKSLSKEYVLQGSEVWNTCVPDMGVEEFTLPFYVTKMARRSMAGNESVRKLTVPESVEVTNYK